MSLVQADPPIYHVQLDDGREARLEQTQLVTGMTKHPAGAIARLQRWYDSRCGGDWEHQLGVKIETLDDPGWLVRIDLQDTPLEARHFTEVRQVEDGRESIDRRVADAVFTGAGGPPILGAIIEVFLRWADGPETP